MTMFSCGSPPQIGAPSRFDPHRAATRLGMTALATALLLANVLLFTSGGDFMFR